MGADSHKIAVMLSEAECLILKHALRAHIGTRPKTACPTAWALRERITALMLTAFSKPKP